MRRSSLRLKVVMIHELRLSLLFYAYHATQRVYIRVQHCHNMSRVGDS